MLLLLAAYGSVVTPPVTTFVAASIKGPKPSGAIDSPNTTGAVKG